ncbi:MAG: hypothetical protein ABEJ60_06605 [Halodesulfurarchaeum sp.]
MNCHTCGYEYDPTDQLECPRCGSTPNCAALSCADCGACPTIEGGLRTAIERLRRD